MIGSFYFIGVVLGLFLSYTLTDIKGKKFMSITSAYLQALFYFGILFLKDSYLYVILLFIILGMGITIAACVCFQYMSEFIPQQNKILVTLVFICIQTLPALDLPITLKYLTNNSFTTIIAGLINVV